MKTVSLIKRSNGSHWVGDGFPVRNIFSYRDLARELSPFVLMDYAGPADFAPTDARRGVGAHPHRGFETVTIVYAGGVSHRDSGGGGGTIGPGDVQWMTAGAGVEHEEFHSPEYARRGGPFEMVQLWVNLPARDKMTPPAYQGITDADIPQVMLPGGAGTVRVIAGEYANVPGPANTFTPMNVWDMRLDAGHDVNLRLPEGHTAALFVLHGEIRFDEQRVGAAELAIMERSGTELAFRVTDEATVLLLSGEPIDEPIAAQGPFVMNSQAELNQAINDYQAGRFGRIPATT